MKTAFITLGLLLATAQAAPRSLKSLLQTNADSEDISLDPATYGFPSNCTITTPPVVPGGPPGVVIVPVCQCAIVANSTGAGLPELSSATYNGFSTGATVTQGQTISTSPDNQ
jgi:hypothetical protein